MTDLSALARRVMGVLDDPLLAFGLVVVIGLFYQAVKIIISDLLARGEQS